MTRVIGITVTIEVQTNKGPIRRQVFLLENETYLDFLARVVAELHEELSSDV